MTEVVLPELKLLSPLTDIVVAYVSNQSVSIGDLLLLISSTHTALRLLSDQSAEVSRDSNNPFVPAVSLKKSPTPDNIVCLECGKSFLSIKRHLNASHGMTPDQYREKWSLPSSYPMVAAKYSAVRATIAKDLWRQAKKPARPNSSSKENA